MSKIYYLKKAPVNTNKNDYNAYFSELFELLGCNALNAEENELPLGNDARGCVLFTGEGNYAEENEKIKEFVKNGGTLLALNSYGLDDLCGVYNAGFFGEGNICADSEFSINGHLRFSDLTYVPKAVPQCRLPVISDIRYCLPNEQTNESVAKQIAYSEEYKVSLIFRRRVGEGKLFYFAFSLLKTCWYKTQGKPVCKDTDGDGCCRAGDSIIVDWSDNHQIPTIDMYLHFLENILWEAGDHPLIHQIPVGEDGAPCDYVMHFSGDEDWCGKDIFDANRELAKRNVPYHVHLQPRTSDFCINKEEYDRVEAEGLELSLHFDFITNNIFMYDFNDVKNQVDLYKSEFNDLPVVTCPHCLCYYGFGETARWYEELGILGMFRQPQSPTDLLNVNAMGLTGFAFGTTYLTHPIDDYEHNNKRFNVVEFKIGFYEPRIVCKEDEVKIDRWTSISDDFALISNIFIHPIYLAQNKATVLPAVDRILKNIKDKRVRLMYTDEIAKWWCARGKSSIKNVEEGCWEADMQDTCVVKFHYEPNCYIDGKKVDTYCKKIAGRDCWLVTVPKGKHEIRVKK